MKIYDCFLFSTELDLLEIRLRENYDHVDQFVLLEADCTFTGLPKSFVFDENQDRFAPWQDKITHIMYQGIDPTLDPWTNETNSRNALAAGIADAEADDIIVLSDADEIIRNSMWKHLRQHNELTNFGFRLANFHFKLNYQQWDWWAGPAATRKFNFKSMQSLRDRREGIGSNQGFVAAHAGWHFQHLGSEETVRTKLKSFSHTEVNVPEIVNNLDIDKLITARQGILAPWGPEQDGYFEVVAVDYYFPDAVKNNPERWQHHIVPNATVSAENFMKDLKAIYRNPDQAK